jgi:hypothetical protein
MDEHEEVDEGWVNGWASEWMNRQKVDGSVGEWMDGRMGQMIN